MFLAIIFLAFTAASPLKAALTPLAQEYVKNNISLKESRNHIYSAKQDTALIKAKKTWNLSYSPTYRRDALQTLSPFSPVKNQTLEHAFTLTKDFEWGGKLILSKRMSHLDQERNSSIFTSNLNTHSFVQEIRYRQNLGADFFGRLFFRETSISKQRRKIVEKEYQKRLQGGLLELSQSYTGARLQRSLIRLQREAQNRAKAINIFVRQRVRDGLREKVDLYRSQSNVHLQREQVYSALQNLEVSLERLSSVLHRKVSPDEIEYYGYTKKMLPSGTPTANNADLQVLAERQHILNQQLAKIRREFFPRISLNLGYKTNAVDEKQTRTWKNGHLFASDHQAKEISLSFNWPIGNAPKKVLKRKLWAEKLTLDTQKKQLAQTLLLRSEQIKKQMSHLKNNILSSQKREKLAYKIVTEMNKLYRKGKTNLDQVLRAEEELIRTQTGFIRHLAQRDMLFYSLLHLYGTLEEHLMIKRDQP